MVARAIAPTGAIMTFIALWTGAFWGKPTWGTWWVWDARLSSSLLLFFLYLGYLALLRANDDSARADRACAVLALLGAVNLPVIYFSVRWWNTLHQGASLSPGKASMAPEMLTALLLMIGAAWAYTAATAFKRVQLIIAEREAQARWLQQLQAEMNESEGDAAANLEAHRA
jgi:heme exporter protein C